MSILRIIQTTSITGWTKLTRARDSMTQQRTDPAFPLYRRSSESGSAYLATLLVLVVLTILGLSLAVITQTEVLIGGSEKQVVRQLFNANAGINLATSTEMVSAGSAAHEFTLQTRTESIFGASTTIADVICTTPYVQIHTGICNLCMFNQDAEFSAVQYGVTVRALRTGDTALGTSKTLGAVIALEPWKRSIAGFQFAAEERLLDPTAPIVMTDETDPCEGLYLKI